MAERPLGYGLTAETKKKIASKYDSEKEQEARQWIEDVLDEPLDANVPPNEPLGPDRLYQALRDGTKLCRLINMLNPGAVPKINQSTMAFKMMENIGNFLAACERYGLIAADLFQTADLYDRQNMWQVVCCLHALGRAAQKHNWQGPVIGVREAQKNVRQFTEEQKRAGQGIIGLQAGYKSGSNQSGMNFGKARDIMQHANTS